MIRSMTGFGDASEQADGVHYSVELRALNNRYFKSTIRLPDEIQGLEAELETQLRHRINRGSVTLTVKMRASDAGAARRVNDEALVAYLQHLGELNKRLGAAAGDGQRVNIDLTALLALPGVLESVDSETMLRQARPMLTRLVDKACERLAAMRASEGRNIAADLDKHLSLIHDRLDRISVRAPQVVEDYHQRLRTRIDELLARAELKLDEKDLVREVAIFAERSDISEEQQRLRGHLEQFRKIVDGPETEPSGRTLDFVTQEMLREANTIASKCSDASVSQAIVEVKGAIDRIKEQVQNVE